MPLLETHIAKARVYLTGSRNKQTRAREDSREDAAVGAVDVPCGVEPLVTHALAEEHRRDEEEISDDEDRDGFDYPPGSSVDTSAAAATTEAVPPPANRSGGIVHSRAARGAFIGAQQPQDAKLKTLEELLNDGFKLVEWDGKETLLAVDSQKRVVGILAGRPNGADDMEKTLEEFEAAMSEAKTNMPCGTAQNGRGAYATAGYGVSSGEGQMRRRTLRHSARNTRRVLNELHGDPAVQRVAHFSNAWSPLYAPKLYTNYHRFRD